MKKIILLLILVLAIVAASLLVGKSQETRKSAFFDESGIVLLGNQDIKTNEKGIVQVKAGGLQEGTKITAFDLSFLVEGVVSSVVKEDIKVESVFGMVVPREVEKISNDSFRVWVTAYTMNTEEDIPGASNSGILPLFSFKFEPREAGTVTVRVDSDIEPDLAGWNPEEGNIDMDIQVNSVDELVFTVTEGGLVGDGPTFNFLVKFSGITEDTDYNQEYKVGVVMVDESGKKYVYKDVLVTRSGPEKGVYKGSLVLAAFPAGDGNFALIKGPKHLQTKYCVDDQSTVCDMAGGDLSFGPDYEEIVYDFTDWPILAGDLPDENMIQDEVVDVGDYTRLVNSWGITVDKDPGKIDRNDINGNGKIEALDLGALLDTLSSKHGALY